jgi:hypothetical protein
MHKTTFNALHRNGFAGRVCTLWDGGEHNGKPGVIIDIIQPRTVRIKLYDETVVDADHRKVPLGDNSDYS